MYSLLYEEQIISVQMLEDVCANNFDSVRFWCFDSGDRNEIKRKLKFILDKCAELNLKAIPVLSDQWGFIKNYNMDVEWYKNGYKNDFMSYASEMISEFKERKEIILWELINEPICSDFEIFYKFVQDSTKQLKTVNENQLITLGTIGGIGNKFGNPFSRFSLKNFEKLYSIKTLDAVSLHDYSYDSTVLERMDILFRFGGKHYKILERINNFISFIPSKLDEYFLNRSKIRIGGFNLRRLWKRYNTKQIEISKKLEKPVYVGEAGYKRKLTNRRRVIELEALELFRKDISGVMLWSFESNGKSVDGHGYGFDGADGISEVVKSIRNSVE